MKFSIKDFFSFIYFYFFRLELDWFLDQSYKFVNAFIK